MKLKSDTRKAPELERVASRDASRPVLSHVYLNTERARLEATNTYAAALVPVEIEEGDDSGLIPAAALKAQRKASKYAAASLGVNGKVTLATSEGEQTWLKGEGQWPDFDRLTPAEFSSFRIGLNPKLLLELAQALGNPECVTIEFARVADKEEGEGVGAFPAALKPMKVTVPAGGDSYGILMPIPIP